MKWGRMANTTLRAFLAAVRQSSVMNGPFTRASGICGALALSAVLSFGAPAAPRVAGARLDAVSGASANEASHPPAVCPRGTLPDGDACVHVPASDQGDGDEGAPLFESSVNTHRDPLGRWVVYDEIPRRPDRPAEYDAYRYHVPCEQS